MKLQIILNGVPKNLLVETGENMQIVLQRAGIHSVRDCDDHFGFAGADIIILDGKPVNAALLLPAQVEGRDIKTVEWLQKDGRLSIVQEALVDAGLVQSGYNAPAVALLLTELLQRCPDPSRVDIDDTLSSIFVRDTGYQQYYQAVDIAKTRLANKEYTKAIAPEFREHLKHIGKVRRKVDAPALVAGKKAFVEDMVSAGHCILKMLRSPHAHAYIRSIDIADAKAVPGVVTIITHENCPDVYYSQAGQGFPEPSPYDRRMFNKKVRHVGDRVAAVVAETQEAAEEALGKINVDYEVLKPVLSIAEAFAENAPIVQNGEIEYVVGAPDDLDKQNASADLRDGKIIYQFPIGANPRKNLAASVADGIGDVSKGFAEADHVLERTYTTSQVQCTPIEPHICYTKMDGERLVIHASTQVPFHLRRITATALGISENRVRVIKERVGGGYGSKQDILLEDVCAYATFITGRDVLFRFSREDEFIANSTRHTFEITVKIGAKNDGKFTAIQMNVFANTGPFGNHCLTVPMNSCSKSLPLYLCDNFYFDVQVCYSNIPPTGAYQGYGAPQGSFALQTAVGELANELGMNVYDLVEKNRIRKGDILEILRCLGEGREGVAAPVESCGLDEALKQGHAMMNWGQPLKAPSDDVAIGRGLAIVQQGSGLPGLDHSGASMKMLGDGTFNLYSGGADIGTGLDTVSAKMAAEILKINMSDVTVISGDTDITPFDTGAYASSGTYFSGAASKACAEDMYKKILEAASAIMQEPMEDLEIIEPGIVKGKKSELPYKKLAWHTQTGEGSGQLMGYASYTTENAAFPYGAHFCELTVHKETGEIKLKKYYALQDCGTPINPEMALGQIYGGVLKSIGHTLYEEMILDKEGRCLNADLRSYGVPLIGDLPEDFQAILIDTDDPYGPFGAKSVSEISLNGASPAIALAVHDAVAVWIREWPITPEKILKALGKFS